MVGRGGWGRGGERRAKDVAERAVLVVRRRDATSSDASDGEKRDVSESLRAVREGDAQVRTMRGGIREDRGREVREVRGMGGDVDDERGVRGGDETRRVVLVVRGKEFARQAWDARERRVRVHGVWGGDGGVRAVRRGRGGDAQALAAGWGIVREVRRGGDDDAQNKHRWTRVRAHDRGVGEGV